MKVLQICNKIPYPEKDGGVIAINAITEGLLNAGCKVRMLAMNTKKHFLDVSFIPAEFRNNRQLETVYVDTSLMPLKALSALLMNKSYNISRFQSKDFEQKLTEILQKEEFDIIHLEGLYVTPYIDIIRQNSKTPIILRAHNIEWKIWQKLALQEKNIVKRWYLNKLSKQLRVFEEKTLNQVDGIAAITNKDLDFFMQSAPQVPMITIPFGIDISSYVPKENKYNNSLFYIGALNWLPNLQGLVWFLKNMWNKLHAKFPEIQFHVAGRNMPESLRNSNYEGVIFHGEVENAKAFMQDYDIMLVPLLAGSGVRVKIIEGMAMGKPIVTTTAGIEGIECKFGQDILVADSPELFAEYVSKCITDIGLKQALAQNARKYVEENYDIGKATSSLLEFYTERISYKK